MRFEGLKQFKDIGLDLNKGVNTCTVTHTHTNTHTHTQTHTAHTHTHTQTHTAHTTQPSTLHMYTSLVFDIHRVDEVSVGGSSRILLHGETHWGDTVPCVVQPNGACVTRQTCSTSTCCGCVCPCMHFLVVCNDGFYPSASVGMVTA